MSDKPAVSDVDSLAETTPPPSRCDNYERYLEDAYGYAYAARDIVSVASLECHDALTESPQKTRREVDGELNDFERLGLARGLYQNGDAAGFADQLETILESDDHHPAVTYMELPLLAARLLAGEGDYERAQDFLEDAAERWPDHATAARREKALVTLLDEGREAAVTVYQQLADDNPDDPELRFEFAEDLAEHDQPHMARVWLERAREVAERVDDRAILVDIELLEERLEGEAEPEQHVGDAPDAP